MKRILSAVFFIFILSPIFAQAIALSAPPAPFEPHIVKAFADSLYQEGFLSQAQGEYKRYLFSIDHSADLNEIQEEEYQSSILALCNIYHKQNDKAGITWLKEGVQVENTYANSRSDSLVGREPL